MDTTDSTANARAKRNNLIAMLVGIPAILGFAAYAHFSDSPSRRAAPVAMPQPSKTLQERLHDAVPGAEISVSDAVIDVRIDLAGEKAPSAFPRPGLMAKDIARAARTDPGMRPLRIAIDGAEKDRYGNMHPVALVRAEYSGETLQRMNIDNIASADIFKAADSLSMHRSVR